MFHDLAVIRLSKIHVQKWLGSPANLDMTAITWGPKNEIFFF